MKNSEIDHAYQFTLYILDGAATLLILESCSGDVLVLRKSFAAKTRAETKKILVKPNKTSCVVFEPSRLLVNATRVLGDF